MRIACIRPPPIAQTVSSLIKRSLWTDIIQVRTIRLAGVLRLGTKPEKKLVFLTNQTTLPAMTICDLYKSRWQVEFFFKWNKQHLRIKKFYGTSENAVKTQI